MTIHTYRDQLWLRNDDLAVDTDLTELKKFCDYCDEADVNIIHAITVRGAVQEIDVKMTDSEIKQAFGDRPITSRTDIVDYLRKRIHDRFAVHGLFHTHEQVQADAFLAYRTLVQVGIRASFFSPPFNENDYPRGFFAGLMVKQFMPRLEDFLVEGAPDSHESYCHFWRFGKRGPWRWSMLEDALTRWRKKFNVRF